MAKKANFNMSEEIRKILTANPSASNKDVYQSLTSSFGKNSVNEASCGVAVSNQRKKLGIGKGRSVKKRRPGRPAKATSMSGGTDLQALRAAKALLSTVGGDEAAAVSAIRQLHSLQIG